MKLIIKYLLIIFSMISCTSNPYKHTINEYGNVDIIYNNGSKINGKLNYPIYFNQKYLFLYGRKKLKLKIEDVKEVIYNMPNKKVKFIRFNINGQEISTKTKDVQFLELISEGKVNLFYGNNFGFSYKGKTKSKFYQKTNLYYCNKQNDSKLNLVYYIDDNNNSRETMKEIFLNYFTENENSINKINSEEFNELSLIKNIKILNNDN